MQKGICADSYLPQTIHAGQFRCVVNAKGMSPSVRILHKQGGKG